MADDKVEKRYKRHEQLLGPSLPTGARVRFSVELLTDWLDRVRGQRRDELLVVSEIVKEDDGTFTLWLSRDHGSRDGDG